MAMLLDVRQLTTQFNLSTGVIKAVNGIDFTLEEGKTLAIVGESGCGKSVTAFSLMQLVQSPGEIVSGKVIFAGEDLLKKSTSEMRRIRGNQISMIFQEPMTSLNPVLTVGAQIMEVLSLHRGLSRKEARQVATDLLYQVGIPAPESRINDYPHQMSGGMRQRVMIAMSLACHPQLLIADEPTTALDVTIQAQILELLSRLKDETGMGMILITHDLGIVAENAHQTAIMYAGRIVEYAATDDLFQTPLHPYTQGLLNSLPQERVPGQRLETIPGSVPDLAIEPPGCGFCDRCPQKNWNCRHELPPMLEVSCGHRVRCWKFA